MTYVKDMNYVNIQGWMISRLKLSGNNLMVFAIIYGFSQDGASTFKGSLQYLADWCGATKQGIQKNLKALLDKGYIEKFEYFENNVKHCEYFSKVSYDGGIQQSFTGVQHSCTGIQQSCTNNTKDKLIENKDSVNTNVLTTEKSVQTSHKPKRKLFDTDNTVDVTVKEEKPKKKNLYEKCVDAINEFTDDHTTKQLLRDYLSLRLQMKDSPIYYGQWKALLKKLDTLSDTEKGIQEIVSQSIERGYKSFFPVNQGYNKSSGWQNDAANKNVKSIQMTDEEKKAFEADIERRKQNGERVTF